MQRVTEQLIHQKYSQVRDLSMNSKDRGNYRTWNFIHEDVDFFSHELEQLKEAREIIIQRRTQNHAFGYIEDL